MNNEELDQHLYRYPSSNVLKNKLGLKDQRIFLKAEQELVSDRIVEGVPRGNFDLKHLQSIHKHLFQDVYEWAGELRQTNIKKGNSVFMPSSRIGFGFQDIAKRLKGQNYLRGLPQDIFARKAGTIIGDINYVHPFREGNGRTQFQYLKQLGRQAGWEIDLNRFERNEWIEASRAVMFSDYDNMRKSIEKAISGPCRPLQPIQNKDWEQDL